MLVYSTIFTHSTEDSGGNLIGGGDHKEVDVYIQDNGSSSNEVVQVRAGQSNQPGNIKIVDLNIKYILMVLYMN